MNDSKRIIREPFSGLSHMAGVAAAVTGLVFLVLAARGRPWHVVSFSIYGASLVALFAASTLYHCLHCSRSVLQRIDHCAIYLLIAGTYLPVCLVAIRGPWGWTLFGIEYGLALVGIGAAVLWRAQPDWFRVTIYILMGWLALVAMGALRQSIPAAGMVWLTAGGVVYTLGAVIFALDRPHLVPGRFSAHDLWHVFVLGGAACHYVLVLRYLT